MSIENPKFNKPEEQLTSIEPEATIISPEGEETSSVPILNRELIKIGTESPEKKAEFVSEKRNLPAGAMIDLYHGLNGGLRAALGVLESPDHGVRQISGPCLQLYPVGQFWKPGDAGFHYSVPRKLFEFPGENSSDAKFRVDDDGTVSLIGGLKALSVTEFNGEVMRTERKEDIYEEQLVDGVLENVVVGEKTVELTDEEKEEETKVVKKISELKASSALKK